MGPLWRGLSPMLAMRQVQVLIKGVGEDAKAVLQRMPVTSLSGLDDLLGHPVSQNKGWVGLTNPGLPGGHVGLGALIRYPELPIVDQPGHQCCEEEVPR